MPAAEQALSTAFLDLDRRRTVAEAGVRASEEIAAGPDLAAGTAGDIGSTWAVVRSRCDAATSSYLALSEQLGGRVTNRPVPPNHRAEVGPVVEQLTAAARAVDEFYHAHRDRLASAQATLAAVPQLAEHARSVAAAAQRRLATLPQFATYPSVHAPATRLAAGLERLAAASRPGARRAAAQQVVAAAGELDAALTAAPGRETEAGTKLTSARTRLAAATTRTEQLGPAYSALLREFNAASSADLTGNDQQARTGLAAAERDLTAATAALRTGDPERAVALAGAARAQLAVAEQAADAVTDRLTLLRQVRDDPRARERATRFRLRDAQMLAVAKGITAEWASVLDAQNERIDRVVGTLAGRHPDYWAYVQGLDNVTTFVSGVVERMRKQPQPG